MGAPKLTRAETAAKFAAGIHCSQCVLSAWADELGYDESETLRMAAAFGGGMFRGDTCGAVSGALMVLGLYYGDGTTETDALVQEKTALFQQKFAERFGSTICRELLGIDLGQPGGKQQAAESGKLLSQCPEYVSGALEILAELTGE